METTIEILTKARGFIERGWCQGPYAMDVNGNEVEAESPKACRWCIYGSLTAAGATSGEVLGGIGYAMYKANGVLPGGFNEDPDRTKDEVLDYFDKIIAAEQAKQPA